MKNLKITFIIIITIALAGLIIAAPSFHTSGISYYLNESQLINYNFTANVTFTNEDRPLNFSFQEIKSSLYDSSIPSFYNWISINSSTGVMDINSTRDNETGQFNISITVLNPTPEGMTSVFYFYVNASNDHPNFTVIENQYNLTQDQNFTQYLNASDEENHFPLVFNISFFNNCSLATWSTRGNCTLFTPTDFQNISSLMNITPNLNDVGVYYANVTVRDSGENYTCSSGYCSPDYSTNKTTYHSDIIVFNVFSTLQVNISNCNNSVFQENQSQTCTINITSKGINSNINISSLAFLRNYDGNVANTTWFYQNNLTNTTNYTTTLYINFTPQKTEIGNWTINLTVSDLNFNQEVTKKIYIQVNRTLNDVPDILEVSNTETSINLLSRINLTVHDDDLLIPDKNHTSGGYNETINFTVTILNQSDLSQELSLNGFDVEVLNMPITNTNQTEAKIEITPNESEAGNYTINITIQDLDGSNDFITFNLSILNNDPPEWNNSVQTTITIFEDNETYLNLSLNVSDPDEDTISFSYTNDTSFPNFSLTTTGIINITPTDLDVGQHIVNISINDGFLSSSKLFNFTVQNINDSVYIQKPIQSGDVINATIDPSSNVNTTEEDITTISIWIQDEDFKIPSNQKAFYNESLTINLTIQGPNSNLFELTKNPAFPTAGNNKSKYEATFTPNKSDTGTYNITINTTDRNNFSSDVLIFNLTISSIEHTPVLTNLSNKTSAVNRTFYLKINATDLEDGNFLESGNSNFTLSYSFISGSDIFNISTFNSSLGIINITFNSSQGGLYHLNITINDSTNRTDSKNFWIKVYDTPNVYFPSSGYVSNLTEGETTNITFTVNHSIGDNLTYKLSIDSTSYNGSNINYRNFSLRYNLTYYGNKTNLTWSFTPNYTDETYGNFKNLTLLTYPSNSELENRTEVNYTITWKLNISHSNAPVVFSGRIEDKQETYNSDIEIDLSSYFSDSDYTDTYYNDTLSFTVQSNKTPSTISSSISGMTLTLSSTVETIELLNITAYDSNSTDNNITNTTSNNFKVTFTSPSQIVVTTPSSGGGTTIVPYAFKLILPGKISGNINEKIIIPLRIENKGKKTFKEINLSSAIHFNENTYKEADIEFSKDFFKTLKPGYSENITMSIFFRKQSIPGSYKIILNATSESPKYTDWGEIIIELKKINKTEIEKIIFFTEEFIVENPECIELKEMLNEAKKLASEEKYAEAKRKVEQIIDACKEYIAQVSLPREKESYNKIYSPLILSLFASFILGMVYYYFRKRRLTSGNDNKKKIKSKKIKPK